MPKVRLKIDNRRGLHARAAAKFVKLANLYNVEVIVTKDGQSVSGKSIMGLLMLAAMPGDKIILETKGLQAQEALSVLSSLVNQKFEER